MLLILKSSRSFAKKLAKLNFMKFYITTSIDYINGKPHIGHAYEKVAADVLARFNRLQAKDVFFLTGTDEHGAKIAAAAEKSVQEIKAYINEMAEHFSKAWDALEISYDRFIRTTDSDHELAVQEIMNRMKSSGALYEAEYSGLYCIGHEAFLTESDLVDGLCPEHKTKPEQITEKNWFLKVSAFTEKIKSAIENDQFKIWPVARRNEILSLLGQGFNDVAITRPNVKWGIRVPWDEQQTVYVWIDALINYISGVGFNSDPELFQKYWPANFHVLGKDIIKFHCIIWPAILLASDLPLPEGALVHGHLTVSGQKISKSIGNVIDPLDWTAKYGAEAVRYFLLREFPFGEDGDVSEEKLKARYEADLANGLGNLVSRLTNMMELYSDGTISEILTPENKLIEVDQLINTFKFNEALVKVWEAIAQANKTIDQTKPWSLQKTEPEQVKKILAQLAAQMYVIALKLAPFMPETADKIRKALESEKIVKIEPLFPRV